MRNMGRRHTTWERLFIAIEGLASGTEDIQERLYAAIVHIQPLLLWEFPEEVQADIKAIRDRLWRRESLEIRCQDIPTEEAREIVKKLVMIYDIVTCEYCTPYTNSPRR